MEKAKIVHETLKSKERKGKIVIVRENNPLANLDGINEYFRQPCSSDDGFGNVYVEYKIAPKRGIYSAEALNVFMNELIPDLEPDEHRDFKEFQKFLYGGYLAFNEKTGEYERIVKKIIRVSGQELLKALKGFENGQKVFEEKNQLIGKERGEYSIKVNVYPYPDEKVALKLLDKETPLRIGIKDLEVYKRMSEGYEPKKWFFQRWLEK